MGTPQSADAPSEQIIESNPVLRAKRPRKDPVEVGPAELRRFLDQA
jgi:hypothetical protein